MTSLCKEEGGEDDEEYDEYEEDPPPSCVTPFNSQAVQIWA